MPSITLDTKKSVEQNAGIYFEKAKKARKKLDGAHKALSKTLQKLDSLSKAAEKQEQQKPAALKKPLKKEWYEKFRWFHTSEGFLCIGGRDATTNDIIIKKHTEKNDIVFHTDMAGSPFFVIKSQAKQITKKALEEAAQATACYSRAWRMGISSIEVFYVSPEQVTKEAKPGEYLGKGAFMIKGKTSYIRAELEAAIGTKHGKTIGGPIKAIAANAEKYTALKPGNEKASNIAKHIKKSIGGEIDEIILFIPAGGSRIIPAKSRA